MSGPFDPFRDFSTAGYLRNTQREKDLKIVKILEHQLFRTQLPQALEYLSRRSRIEYRDFLEVHQILFGALYPWAGQDRMQTLPDRAVTRGDVYFCEPSLCERAVSEGLRLGQDPLVMAHRPGHVMGFFAYGHPFLDGNGRTMLLVHAELCMRAGISVDWPRTTKAAYLKALTDEIEDPKGGHLDKYLQPYVAPAVTREWWLQSAANLPGLDGAGPSTDAAHSYADPDVREQYQQFERRRGYDLR